MLGVRLGGLGPTMGAGLEEEAGGAVVLRVRALRKEFRSGTIKKRVPGRNRNKCHSRFQGFVITENPVALEDWKAFRWWG